MMRNEGTGEAAGHEAPVERRGNMRKTWLFMLIGALVLPAAALGQGCMGGGGEEGVNVVGFIQPQLEYYPNPDSDEEQFTFSYCRARLGVVGDVPYDISYYFMMEFAPFMTDSPYMLDAYMSYTRLPFAKISFGQFKQPFSMERNSSCAGLHTVYRSKVVEELAMDRDLGIMALGTVAEGLEYRLAVMNGTGKNSKDDNKGKDIVGRVIYSPCDYATLGAGFVSGNSKSVVEGADDDTKTRYGGDIEIRYMNFLAQAEYIYGKDEGSYTTGGGCGGDPEIVQGTVKRNGFFATVLYETEWNLQPVLKYERYDPDMDADDDTPETDTWNSWTFGFNYFLNDWTRLQVNYIRNIEDFVPAYDNDEFVIQMQVKIQ
jgi:hypothetical protein